MNTQHRLGMDQNGQIGGDLFTPLNDSALRSARVLAQASNNGDALLEVTIDSVAALGNSDYRLSYDGAAFQLVRMSDDTLVGTFAGLPQDLASEGFGIGLSGGSVAAGDSFLIRPSASAARQMRRVLPDGSSLALASPVRAAAMADNLGEARIGSVTAAGLTGVPLADAVTLTYDGSAGGFLVGTPPGGVLAYDPTADSGSSLTLAVPGFGELHFVVTGIPEDGDRLTLESNRLGVGDNSNALALSGLQEAQILLGGTASLGQAYERTVGEIASRTSGLSLAADAQEVLLHRAEQSRESISGVNLDEEAAALLRYQQAYEACARVIAVSDELFQTLLNALGG
jgi:flagellar hook-associated protein 1 FlgK